MAKGIFKHVRIHSIATTVPSNSKSIDEELELFGNQRAINKLKNITGLHYRRIVDENTTSVDLCSYSVKNLLQELQIDKNEIDGVVFVTQTPDYRIPNCASVVQGMLGLGEQCICYDINHGCSGYIYGLLNVFSLVETGVCKKMLLLVGDTLSKVINPKDKSLVIIHGDAGSATLIEHSEEEIESHFVLHSQGTKAESIIIRAGGFRNMSTTESRIEKRDSEGNIRTEEQLYMNGLEVFNFAITNVPCLVNEVLEFAGHSIEEIDFFAFHQANGIINKGIVQKLGLREEVAPYRVIKKYGNSSCCSIPQVFSEALGSDKQLPKNLVLMVGFGVGLSLGSCCTSLNDTIILPTINYNN